MKPMTIGQVARSAGIGVETVRFYERQGLIEEPARRASGYRQYDEAVVARLGFIRRAKELGFTPKEIGDLLSLRLDPAASRGDVKRRAEAKIIDIDNRIRSLKGMRKALSKLTEKCSGHGTTSECPILEAMNGKEKSNGQAEHPRR